MTRNEFEVAVQRYYDDLLDYARQRLHERLAPRFIERDPNRPPNATKPVRTQFAAEEAVDQAVADLLERREWERCTPGDDLWRFLKRAVRHRVQRIFKQRTVARLRFHDGTLFYDRADDADIESQTASEWASARDPAGSNMQPEFIVPQLGRYDEPGTRAHDEPAYVPERVWPARHARDLETLHAVRIDLLRAFEAAGVPFHGRFALWPFRRPIKYVPEPTPCPSCRARRQHEIESDGTVEVDTLVCANGHRGQTVRELARQGDEKDWRSDTRLYLPPDEYRRCYGLPRDPEKVVEAEAIFLRRAREQMRAAWLFRPEYERGLVGPKRPEIPLSVRRKRATAKRTDITEIIPVGGSAALSQ